MITRKEFLHIIGLGAAAGVLPVRGTWSVDAAEKLESFQQDAEGQVKITLADLQSAMKIADLSFSDAELNAILRDVSATRSAWGELRDGTSSWQLSPAHAFRVYDAGSRPIGETSATPRVVTELEKPMNEEDIAFLSLPQMGLLLSTQQITSTDLTKIYIKRLKQYGEKLRCLVTLLEDQALAEAAQADRVISQGGYLGPLHGIPYGIKDLFAAKGAPTTWGSEPHKDQVFDFDAHIVQTLRDQGAILLAKLSMGALAQGDVWFKGRTESPWDKKIGSSGSSAGSASATSAGLVAFSIGTETSGSIVSPSHNCRVTGFRPTFGQVGRSGAMPLSWSMDKAGPICRSAEDCALVLSCIMTPDPADPGHAPAQLQYQGGGSIDKFKIGYLVTREDALKPVDMTARPYLKMMSEMGIEPVPVYLPPGPRAMSIVLLSECSASFDAFTRSDEIDKLKNSSWPATFREARFIPATELVLADRARRTMMQQYHEALEGFDAVIVEDRGYPRVYQLNLTGHPQVLVPFGTDEAGRPISFSVIGPTYSDAKLLQLADAIQQKAGFHLKRPDLSIWEA